MCIRDRCGNPQRARGGETIADFSERMYRYVVELHDTTARAYGMPTQADFHRAVALRAAASKEALTAGTEEPPSEDASS